MWRAIARAVLVIPRVLESELMEEQGLNIAEYKVLMTLSERPGRSTRMSELADAVAMSLSGLSRVVDRLERRELIARVRDESDGRGQVARLSKAGMDRLRKAYPSHLGSVRRHVVDHLAGLDLTALAAAFRKIGERDI
ncbi:MarR family winged helix-turn-helix transcriptional regulator [Saccharopolyspora sp. 5N708]|uniref:MarR family winged helix-turn-helix transcriptional regulator n=1 Tax=Saccharopolyspora sp. 5N708 TaxID=3457424 RepID=UPI003FD51CE0